MKYVLLIYQAEAELDTSPEATDAVIADYLAFTEDLARSGRMHGCESLEPTDCATTVRVRDGAAQTTDGPFAETKEQLGGFYVIECADLDEAVAIAARIPGARHGSIEIRPLTVFEAA